MPLTPPGLTLAVAGGLAGTGHLGTGMPKLAAGVAAGVIAWNSGGVKVVTVDVGAIGAGAGSIPLIMPPPLLIGGLTGGFAAMALSGVFAPLTIVGLATGLVAGFAQGLIVTAHAGVGAGTGVVKIVGSSAVPFMIAGFASVAMVSPGSVKMATAIGIGIDTAFAAFTTVTPILGGAGPAPSTGAGFGTIV
jgi:hypothetical protein